MSEPTQQDIQQLTTSIKELTRTFQTAGTGTRSSGGRSSRPGSGGNNRTTQNNPVEDVVGPYSLLGSRRNPRSSKKFQELEEELDDAKKGLKKLTNNSSLLAAAAIDTTKLFADTRQIAFFKDILEQSGQLIKSGVNPHFVALARSMNMLKEGTDEFRDGLDSADFAKLSIATGMATNTVAEANAKAAELMSALETQLKDANASDALAKIAEIKAGGGSALAQLQKIKDDKVNFGIDSAGQSYLPEKIEKDLDQVVAVVKQKLTEQGVTLAALNGSTKELITEFDDLGEKLPRVNKIYTDTVIKHASVLTQAGDQVKSSFDKLVQSALGAVASLGSLANFKSKMKALYSEIAEFNIANVADTFKNTQLRSVELGVSFKQLVDLYKENARVLTVYGANNFGNLLSNLSGTFKQYGYTFEQGSKLIGPAIQNAVLEGVKVTDQAELTSYVDQTLKNAQMMSTVTGKSADAIMAYHRDVLQSEGVFKNMMGMDKQRRAAYAQEIKQTTDRLVLDGMEYEQAVAVVKAQQDAARAPVREKFEKAAYRTMAARMAGLDPEEIQRLRQLSLQTSFGTGEQEEFAALQGKVARGIEERFQTADRDTNRMANATLFQNQMIMGKAGFDQTITTAAESARRKQAAGLGITPEQATQQAALARGSEAVADFGNKLNTITSIFENAFTGSLVAAIAGVIGLAGAATKAMLALRALGVVKGGLPGLDGIATEGVLKGGGTILGKAKNLATGLLGRGALVAVGAAGADAIAGQLGAGTDANGKPIVLDTKQDDENWNKMNTWQKFESGAARGIEKGARLLFMGNMADSAAASRIEAESKYLAANAGQAVPGMPASALTGMPGMAGMPIAASVLGSMQGPGGVNNTMFAAENMQTLSAPKTFTVSDKDANATLQAIAVSMTEAVRLLKEIAEPTIETLSTPIRRSTFEVPTAAQFITGNG